MPYLSLALLGGFAATRDGQDLTAFGTDKVRALLAYLAVESARPHQRAALAELLWPDSLPSKAAQNLRQTLLLLRRALGDDEGAPGPSHRPLLLLTRQTIQLHPLSNWRLDVAVFVELLRSCQEHSHEQAATCRVCMGWLAQAVDHYRGDFLAGFTLRDSVPFEEWQLLQQETLHRQAVDALARLASYHEGRSEFALVQRYAGQLVGLDPWHEQGRLQLMRALAQSGQTTAAAEQYAAYSAALEREFGVLPASEVTALYQQIQARQLGGSTAVPSALAGSSTGMKGERRQITALICSWRDLAGGDDPEDLFQRLEHYETRLAMLLDRYGGHRPLRQGDEWLVYFGYPQAYEDAARRAVHVGLSLVAATREGDQVRVGIHTDVMIVGSGEPAGDAPSVSRACHNLAEPGMVLITAATERLVRGWFTCRSLGLVVGSGAAQHGVAYHVQGEQVGRSHLAWLAQLEHLTPFAGREQELAQLGSLLEAAARGRGATATLSAEPGLGKSRLLWELRQRSGPSITWFERRCLPYYQNTHLYPLVGLVEDLLGIGEGDSPETRGARLASALADYSLDQPGAAWLLSILLGLPTEPPVPQPITARQRERMREVVVALIQRAAATRPLVLVIEDLHWADPSTIAWLGASLEALAAAPCLTLLTYRPTFSPPWLPGLHLHPLTLVPLQPAAAAQMVADLTRASTLPTTLHRRIVAQSDGVPLFVEELTRTLRESGVQSANAAIPTTLRDSLLARLERVGAARETAGWAAALGREFDYPVLAAVVPYDEPRLQADLAVLIEAGLLMIQRHHEREMGYAFKHTLMQEATHSTLLRHTRQTYHRRIAERYAEDFPELAKARPELLAQHYQQGDLRPQAADCWLLAGERAFAQGAGQEGRTFFENALQLIAPDEPERRWRALTGQERALSLSGEREALKTTIAALHELAEGWDNDTWRAYAALREIRYAGSSGDFHGVLDRVDAAIATTRRAASQGLELEALVYKAQTLAAFQELEAARQVLETALPYLERVHEQALRARTLTAYAYYWLEVGDLAQAVLTQWQSLEAAQRGGDHQLLLTISANLGLLYVTLGLYAEARTTLERCREQAALVGEVRILAGSLRLLGLLSWGNEEPARARALFEQALEQLAAIGDTDGSAACHAQLGYVLEAAGDYALAAEHLARARAGFADMGVVENQFETQAAEARAVLALGQRNTARQLATEVWSYLCDQGFNGITEHSLVCLCLADVFAALGEQDVTPEEVIALGYRHLTQRAEKISDPEWRRSFLENVPANRELVERWRQSGAVR